MQGNSQRERVSEWHEEEGMAGEPKLNKSFYLLAIFRHGKLTGKTRIGIKVITLEGRGRGRWLLWNIKKGLEGTSSGLVFTISYPPLTAVLRVVGGV